MKVAYQAGTRWAVETVEGNGCGFNSSLEVTKDELLLAYSDAVRGGLKVARRPLSASVSSIDRPADVPAPSTKASK